MSRTFAALTFALCASAQAADLPVKVTSFFRPDQGTRMAELCGKVTGTPEQLAVAKVRIAVDGSSKGVGIYNTTTDENGDFCMTLTTFYGKANVTATAP